MTNNMCRTFAQCISSYHATETFSGRSNTNLTVKTSVMDTQIPISLSKHMLWTLKYESHCQNICYGYSNTNITVKTKIVDTQTLSVYVVDT